MTKPSIIDATRTPERRADGTIGTPAMRAWIGPDVQLARLEAPYYTAPLLSLIPVDAPGLATAAVRPDGTLLIDSAWWQTLPPEQRAGILIHEARHVVFDHARRWEAWAESACVTEDDKVNGVPIRLVAADLEDNAGLVFAGTPEAKDRRAVLPPDGLRGALYGLPDMATMEQYAARLWQMRDAGGKPPPPPPGPGGKPGGEGRGPGTPRECGSGATGVESDAERRAAEAARARGDYPSPDEAGLDTRADSIRRQVAEAVRVHVRTHGRGSVPADLAAWADDPSVVAPVVPWRDTLRRAVTGVVDQSRRGTSGSTTYSRPSRRTVAGRAGGTVTVRPSTVQLVPRVGVVIDTSGSVSDAMLRRALDEVEAGIRAIPRVVIDAAMCDSACHVTRGVHGLAGFRAVPVKGRGGTDLRVGIAALMDTDAPPHSLIVLTDGYTPWPASKPDGLRGSFVVAVLDPPADRGPLGIPEWATVVECVTPTGRD